MRGLNPFETSRRTCARFVAYVLHPRHAERNAQARSISISLMKYLRWLVAFFPATLLLAETPVPLPIKVVIVSMFQGKGDQPGERRLWQQRLHLEQNYPLPAADSDAWTDGNGVLVYTTGMGVSNAAASTMALGLDPRFDLRQAYWLIAGIAGIDPADGSMGSAVWARYVVDGGLAHELDAREIPDNWSTGYIPLGSSRPFDHNGHPTNPSQVFELNRGLAQWAYSLTKDTVLPDTPALAKRRSEFTGYPNAQRAPFVLMGDNLSDSTFWHGEKMTKFGNDWVDFWTDHQGKFATKAMEDSGTLQSLRNLARAGKVDFNRVMVLRTASNYTMQSPDMTAWQSLARERGASLSAFNEALEAAFVVGNRVVQTLLKDWPMAQNTIPAASVTVQALPDDPACDADDRRFMSRAYELARSSVVHGNHPFSALLVKDGKIIFEYENTIYSTRDITQHAETGLIGKATQQFDPATLAASTLYASTEPCVMCCGAIRWAGIHRVVYGTTSSQLSRVIEQILPPKAPSAGRPPLALECREVFARTEPSIKVFGPLMEEEGLTIHEGYWANDPVLKGYIAKQQK